MLCDMTTNTSTFYLAVYKFISWSGICVHWIFHCSKHAKFIFYIKYIFSRSHTILTVYITSEQPTDDGVFISRSGKINFVDLAGSEMTKKTQSAGKTLQEANNINNSLMVLGNYKHCYSK